MRCADEIPATDQLLADGTLVHVRALHPDDRDRLVTFYAQLSERSRYQRFFSSVAPQLAVRENRVLQGDDAGVGLVAEADHTIVAIAEYIITGDAIGDVAEVAFAVADGYQGRGLGTLLLERLVAIARERGVTRFVADYLSHNDGMRRVLRDAGFTVRWGRVDPTVGEAELDLTPTETWETAHACREHTAEARSIARLLNPTSIAVIGAGRDERSIGRAIVQNLVESGFTGRIHPVNAHAAVIAGRETVPSVLDVQGNVDLAVIAVPAASVLDVVEQCARKGARGVVVISGGFAELPGGESAQAELVALARRHGMRLIGPNCVGVANMAPGISMNATFSPVVPRPGRIGFASQSGGVGIEFLARAASRDLGISTFVSLGNKADVSPNDLLQYWSDDPATDVVLLYLESFGNPRKFATIARDLSRRKPVLVMKSGRTPAGARATRSHTAALADSDAAVDELLRHTGVARLDTLEELLDAATLVAHQRLPRGRRVAIVSNGGGPGILAADACVAAGLEVPELSPTIRAQLAAGLPKGASAQNPIDLVAAATADDYRNASRAVLASGEIDALLVLYVAPHVTRPADIEHAVSDVASDATDIPIAACFLGLDRTPPPLPLRSRSGAVPTFAFPEAAARAIARAAEIGAWRQRPEGRVLQPAVDTACARRRVDDAWEGGVRGEWVDAAFAYALLADYGINVVESRYAATAAEAAAAADAIGYPVVVKVSAPELVHKTDVGGVRLQLASAGQVRTAFAEMEHDRGVALGGVVVQPMVGPGVELLAGITHDPQFGPLLVFGMGGLAAELQHDVVLRIPPFTDVDVDEMLHALRASPLLFGYRGAQPVDVTAVADQLARIGRLAVEVPEIAELDCNPIIASSTGAVVVDVKLRLAADADVACSRGPSPLG